MSVVIRTYPLPSPSNGQSTAELTMPEGARVLSVNRQGNDTFLSALVDPARPLQQRAFLMLAEGEENEGGWGRFLGVVRLQSTDYHVFDTW